VWLWTHGRWRLPPLHYHQYNASSVAALTHLYLQHSLDLVAGMCMQQVIRLVVGVVGSLQGCNSQQN
jgi:hypothetical protein